MNLRAPRRPRWTGGVARATLVVCLCVLVHVDTLHAESEATESVGGVLRLQGDAAAQPVAGALITLQRLDGGSLRSTQSDAQGRFKLAVPGAGSYVVALDTGSLPRGVTLRAGRGATLNLDVLAGQQLTVLFPLQKTSAAAPTLSPGAAPSGALGVAQLLLDGLVFGLILAMAAVGVSLIYSVSGVINFAHGEFMTIGALLAFALSTFERGPQWPLVAAALVAVLAVAGLGGALEFSLFRRLVTRAQEHFAILVFTIGLSFSLRYLLLYLFGANSQPYLQYSLQQPIALAGVTLAPRDAWIIGLCSATLLGLGLLLQRTRLGQAMRAVAGNASLASASGIDVQRIVSGVWILGAALAAAAGIVLAVSQQVRWDMGYQMLMFTFAALILGGIGTSFGTIAGGIVVGVAMSLSTAVIPAELKAAVAMLAMTLVLLLRPQGLINRAQRAG